MFQCVRFAAVLLILFKCTSNALSLELSRKNNSGSTNPSAGMLNKTENLTDEEIATVLRDRGYEVKEIFGGRPVLIVKDIAYTPAQILPELAKNQGRVTPFQIGNLWKDTEDRAHVFYYFQNKTHADHEVFKAAVNT